MNVVLTLDTVDILMNGYVKKFVPYEILTAESWN